MAKYVEQGESIECDISHIQVRKISYNPTFLDIEKLDGGSIKVYKYKSNKRAILAIAKELNPKKRVINKTSRIDLKDELEAEVVEIFCTKKIAFNIVSNFSHVHGIQGNTVNAFVYAKIVIPWQFVLDRLKIENRTPKAIEN